MSKTEWNLTNILGAIVIGIGLLGSGIGGTLAVGAMKSDIKTNKDDISDAEDERGEMRADDKELAKAVQGLQLTIRDLTAAIKHEHGGD